MMIFDNFVLFHHHENKKNIAAIDRNLCKKSVLRVREREKFLGKEIFREKNFKDVFFLCPNIQKKLLNGGPCLCFVLFVFDICFDVCFEIITIILRDGCFCFRGASGGMGEEGGYLDVFLV